MKCFNVIVLLAIMMLIPLIGHSQTWLESDNTLNFNGLRFRLNPYVQIRHDQLVYETLSFNVATTSYADSCIISYTNPYVNFSISIAPKEGLAASAQQVRINTTCLQDVYIRDFKLNLVFPDEYSFSVFKGPKAIQSQNMADNIQTCTYTDRAVQYKVNDNSIWVVGSNYEGCDNIELIQDRSINLYDHTMHLARMYDASIDQFTIMADTMKRKAGNTNYWSFLIFTEMPTILSINRWDDKKKAALVITNDADGETERKMKAVYFGSNNSNNPKYLTDGLIANNIKVTNTVFGASLPVLGTLWHSLQGYGNTIGYHTYSTYSDLSADTYNSLTGPMCDYGVRTWIDHSWVNNPDALCNQGWNPASPHYILDAINASNIDYFWLGDNLSTNPINSFDEPGRLPHRLYEFDDLTRPLWFFGRTKMQGWEFYGNSYLVDMKHNLTPENLDKLLAANGLCVAYTHFFFDENSTISAFFHYTGDGSCEIKDEVNDRLRLLDYYQTYRDLWIDTLENVFDRMIAVEDVKITSINKDHRGNLISVKMANKSAYPISRLYVKYMDQEFILPYLSAASGIDLSVEGGTEIVATPEEHNINIYFLGHTIHLKRQDGDYIAPLTVKIYNIKGQLATSYTMPEQTKHVAIPFIKHASGVYIARMETNTGFIKTVRFQVVK